MNETNTKCTMCANLRTEIRNMRDNVENCIHETNDSCAWITKGKAMEKVLRNIYNHHFRLGFPYRKAHMKRDIESVIDVNRPGRVWNRHWTSETLKTIFLVLALFGLATAQEAATKEELKILQWHLSESQAMEAEGMHCNPVDNMDICVRMRQPETTYTLNQQTFLDTLVGTKRGKRFYLTNKGSMDLICNKPVLSGPFTSSFTADKRAVAPGGILTFTLYFSPTTIGQHSTVMKLVCNDYEKPYEFLISGVGK